jgi:hypothetical protein
LLEFARKMYKLILALAAARVLAAPASFHLERRQSAPFEQTMQAWDAGSVTAFPIHSSCNSTQKAQIAAGLNETIVLAQHAMDHILRWGNSSELYQKYFNQLPPYEAIGVLDMIVNGNKGGVLFRCDDPDGNCHQEGQYRPVSRDLGRG